MRVRTLTVVVVATGLMLAGCGGSSNSGARNKPTTPTGQLLLGEADFPAGAKVQQLSQQQLDKAGSDLAAMKDATFDPPECKANQQNLIKAMQGFFSHASAVSALDMSKGNTYVDAVMDTAPDLGRYKDNVTGRCASAKVTLAVDGQKIQTSTHTTSVALPSDLASDGSFAYRMNTDMASAPGQQRPTTTALTGVAEVRGMGVLVRLSSLSGPVDRAAFDKLFTAAVRKVRNAP